MKTRLALVALLAACSTATVDPPPEKPPFSGHFTDVTPADLPGAMPPADPQKPENWAYGTFGDLDGDGKHDLALSGAGFVRSYKLDEAGKWVPDGHEWINHLSPQAILDLDDDGRADVIYSGGDIEWGAPERRPLEGLFRAAAWQQGMDTAFGDVDRDGLLDVVGAGLCCSNTGPCRDLAVDLRTGARAFRLLDETSGMLPGPRVKSYLAGPLSFGGDPMLLQLGEKCPSVPEGQPAFFRPKTADEAGYPVFETFDPLPPDAIFREGRADRTLVSLAPMGAAVGDLDNDGRLDFVVATNPYLEIFRQQEDGTFVSKGAASGITRRAGEKNFQLPWGIAVLDVNQDGLNDLVVAYGNDGNAHSIPRDYIGPQDVAVYVNQGDFRFADGTKAAGARKGQWKSVVVDDFDCDGDPDLVIGGNDEWPQVLRNDIGDHTHALSLRLHGNLSNSQGLGAIVEAWPEGGAPVRRALVGGILSPHAYSPAAAYVGLGSATKAERVRITWPSGVVQEVGNLPGGRCVSIEEPRIVSMVPASRHAKAGEKIRILVTPRDLDGTPRDTDVQLRVLTGPAEATLTKVAGGLQADLAQEEPGSSTIEIKIDQVALKVQPRLWWDP